LIAVLFRLIEPAGGKVLIDGVDISSVGLDALRSRITIIPQEPILMSGTVRYNLDPFNEFDDALLSESLARVGLGKVALADSIEAKGSNISAGERQLLCFARALVLKSHRIVVMDEVCLGCLTEARVLN
jgi:ABC-type multidrug transport system fused ATPase/permease subunit